MRTVLYPFRVNADFLLWFNSRFARRENFALSACATLTLCAFDSPSSFHSRARKNYSEPRRRVPKYDFIFERVRAEAKILFLIITRF